MVDKLQKLGLETHQISQLLQFDEVIVNESIRIIERSKKPIDYPYKYLLKICTELKTKGFKVVVAPKVEIGGLYKPIEKKKLSAIQMAIEMRNFMKPEPLKQGSALWGNRVSNDLRNIAAKNKLDEGYELIGEEHESIAVMYIDKVRTYLEGKNVPEKINIVERVVME